MPASLAVCSIDFAVDGVVLAHQPYSVRLITPEPALLRTTAGRHLAVRRFGHRVVVQWGEAALSSEVVSYLRSVLAASVITIGWTEPTGEPISLRVIREPLRTRFRWDQPGFYEPLIVTMLERPPLPSA